MAETIITYETIYEKLRKEKYDPEIQQLPESFFSDVIEYLKEKQIILETQKSQTSMFSSEIEKTEKQVQNIKKILRELYERRESKIIQLALFASRAGTQTDISNLLPEEQEFYKNVVEVLDLCRKGILKNILSLKYPSIDRPKDIKAENEEKVKLVRFISSVPKFMGEDLNIYGPFSEEDIAALPPKVASLLIKKKRVKEVKTA